MIEQLYKKKIIRDFLSLFTENKWKTLISSILEYGILKLKKNYNIASLTADDILNLIEDVKKAENPNPTKHKEESYSETRILSTKSKTNKETSKPSSKVKKLKKEVSLSKRSETPVKSSM